ncbi:MAG TPA: hypothetical protein VN969_37140 [Streptosporangiaceae bacterium]|nr:hypothetical protein [Streptosporangiaceae bacterium]
MRRRTGTEHMEEAPLADTITDPLSLLSEPVASDDLTPALARRPRVKLPSLTMFLIAAVIAGGGFYAGALVGKHNAGTGTGSLAAAFRGAAAATGTAGARTGRTGTGGFGGFEGGGTGGTGGTGAAGDDTIGTIELVEGNVVYVKTEAGTTVEVKVSNATKISISSTGTVKDLTPGQTVIVGGAAGTGGAVSATSITQSSGLGSFSGG